MAVAMAPGKDGGWGGEGQAGRGCMGRMLHPSNPGNEAVAHSISFLQGTPGRRQGTPQWAGRGQRETPAEMGSQHCL